MISITAEGGNTKDRDKEVFYKLIESSGNTVVRVRKGPHAVKGPTVHGYQNSDAHINKEGIATVRDRPVHEGGVLRFEKDPSGFGIVGYLIKTTHNMNMLCADQHLGLVTIEDKDTKKEAEELFDKRYALMSAQQKSDFEKLKRDTLGHWQDDTTSRSEEEIVLERNRRLEKEVEELKKKLEQGATVSAASQDDISIELPPDRPETEATFFDETKERVKLENMPYQELVKLAKDRGLYDRKERKASAIANKIIEDMIIEKKIGD